MTASSSKEIAPDVRLRILRTARQHLFAHGYVTLTMDVLAHELGMSKKTLYVHFAGKDALLDAVVDDFSRSLRTEMDAVLDQPRLAFTQKLQGVVGAALSHIGRLTPGALRELQRYSPRHYERIDRVRRENIPQIFGRLIRAGIAEGGVRPDVDADFAAQFWLQAIRGLVQPDVLDLTGLSPRQTLDRALHLFFSGLLTPAGRKDYEHQRRQTAAA